MEPENSVTVQPSTVAVYRLRNGNVKLVSPVVGSLVLETIGTTESQIKTLLVVTKVLVFKSGPNKDLCKEFTAHKVCQTTTDDYTKTVTYNKLLPLVFKCSTRKGVTDWYDSIKYNPWFVRRGISRQLNWETD